VNELTNEKTMTVKEVAESLGVSRQTVEASILELSQCQLISIGKVQGSHGGSPAYALDEEAVTAIKLNLSPNKIVQSQPKTELEKALIIRQAMGFLNERVTFLETENAMLEKENDRLKTIADEHAEHWSVCEYHQRNNRRYDNKAGIAMGKALSAISRRNGLPIYKVKAYDTTGRFLNVNAYTREAWALYEVAAYVE
jgi:DNA-binding transcriptional regulator GbsR (MarR family)